MLVTLLKNKCFELGLSSRQASKEIGVAHTTVLRTLRGESIDLDTLVKFSDWLDVKPNTLLNSMTKKAGGLSDKIAVMLESKKSLAHEFEKAIGEIIKGKVDASVIEDIASYAAYVINLKTVKG